MHGGDGPFEAEPVERKRSGGRPEAVDKTFRTFDPHRILLLPPSLDDWLPEDHPARFVADPVDAGHCSGANPDAARRRQLVCGTDTSISTGRLAHDEQVPPHRVGGCQRTPR